MKGNVEVVSFFVEKGMWIIENCLVFVVYFFKVILLFFIFVLVNDSSWVNEVVNKVIEIVCMKYDFLFLECILSIKWID